MLLKPGDKVSFLNEKRDGIVKKILNNKMVLIEIDDGFEIPVLEHDLVKANSFDDYNDNTKNINAEIQDIHEEENEERFPNRIDLFEVIDDKNKTKKGIYISFIPENPEGILSSGFGIYLVNHYSHDILFTYYLKDQDKYLCKDFDRAYEESAILLDIIDKSDIEKWKNILFQILFFKKDSFLNIPPVVHEIHIKPVRFYKEDNFVFYPLLNEKCFMVSVSEKEKNQPEEWPEEKWKNKKNEKPSGLKIIGHINEINKIEPFPEKHIIEKGIAEVDLHIEELTDDYSGKENFELLNIQLGYFSKMMESALANKFKKIIFIHGSGSGKLKQEIINKLQNNYSDLKFCDASVLRYGKGATEIELIS